MTCTVHILAIVKLIMLIIEVPSEVNYVLMVVVVVVSTVVIIGIVVVVVSIVAVRK